MLAVPLMLFVDVVVHQQLQRPNQVHRCESPLELNLVEFYLPRMLQQFFVVKPMRNCQLAL